MGHYASYTQSKTMLNHIVIYHLYAKLKKNYPKNTILQVVKLLYSLVEVENYWFATYLNYYKKKLGIDILFYNTCLFIIKTNDKNFGFTKLQTNNIFNVKIAIFMNKKEAEIINAKFKAKL